MCPGVTDTEMTKYIIGGFKNAELYWQPADAVGKIIVGIQADPALIGRAYYIEGGDAWEFEKSFYDMQPQWLGESSSHLHFTFICHRGI